jgi:glycosyltransferase involved in cell wall biosynthesis
LKILFITPRFQPEVGGVEKHTYYVAKELANHGNKIEIITITQRTDLKTDEQQNGMLVHRLLLASRGNHWLNVAFGLLSMWFFLSKNFRLLVGSTVVHLHDWQTFLWIFPFIPLLRRPLFITFHGFESYPIPVSAKVIRKIAEKLVDGNICVGAFLTKWYNTKPDFTIIGGVEAAQLPSDSHIEKAALFMGRLAEDTGISEFTEALGILKQEFGIDIPLHICGDGPLKPRIKENARHDNLKIFMHGFQKNSQEYLARYSYAFVSGYLSILEAMYQRTPVFTIYNNPLKKDYLCSIPNANDLMVITASPKELAEKLRIAIKNPQQIDPILERAYSFACKQTWEKVANVYLELYQKKEDSIYR